MLKEIYKEKRGTGGEEINLSNSPIDLFTLFRPFLPPLISETFMTMPMSSQLNNEGETLIVGLRLFFDIADQSSIQAQEMNHLRDEDGEKVRKKAKTNKEEKNRH